MAPKRKNAFMVFTYEWKEKHGKHLNMRDATTEAGKIWANMNAQERGPFIEKAKRSRNNLTANPQLLSCTGKPLSIIETEKQDMENRERIMKRTIETVVRNSVKDEELEIKSYYFIMVNYFTRKLRGGDYLPAEISLAEYSLKDGVCRKFHTLINPGADLYGLQYEAQHLSETTHKLPLPPNAKGERNLPRIYNEIIQFIHDISADTWPPVYTLRESVPVVESVLKFLKEAGDSVDIELKVYPIQYLFFIMKEATCEVGELDKPASHYITDAYFERDFFEYQSGIACEYHEEVDKSKYCTQSYVTRWGYMFSDYMCRDIAILPIPGRHVPLETNLRAILRTVPKATADPDAEAVGENLRGFYYQEQKVDVDSMPSSSFAGATDYVSAIRPGDPVGIGARKKMPISHTNTTRMSTSRNTTKDITESYNSDDDDGSDTNPWVSRSRRVAPRRPDSQSFNINYTRDDMSDFDDFNSVSSYGRGRGYILGQPNLRR